MSNRRKSQPVRSDSRVGNDLSDVVDTQEWIELQLPKTTTFRLEKSKIIDWSKELDGNICEKELQFFGISSLNGNLPETGISEDAVDLDIFSWRDEDNTVLLLLDQFLLTNTAGNPVSLESLDAQQGGYLLFGNLIEPQSLAPGEAPTLWNRSRLSNLKRSPRVNGIRCTEYCIDVSYGDESLWVIAESGRWYKIRGEQGPGSAIMASPLYRAAFEESRRKYEACMLISRLLVSKNQGSSKSKKMQLPNLIAEVVALSEGGDWQFDEAFFLSRSDFIVEQIQEISDFGGAPVGQTFATEMKRQRDQLIRKLITNKQRPATEKKKKRKDRPSDALEDDDQQRKKANGGLQDPHNFRFPMPDVELMAATAEALRDPHFKVPNVLQRIHLHEEDSAAEYLPCYSKPPDPEPIYDEPRLALSADTLGSVLSSFGILHVMMEYLRIAPFGLHELVMSIVFRPPASSKAFTPHLLSPLYVEIILRLIDFILAQPEHESIRNAILGHTSEAGTDIEAESIAGIPSLLSELSWPNVLGQLITQVENLAPVNPLGSQSPDLAALDFCKSVLLDVMEDPRTYPFLTKVDPVALNLPTYFDVVEKPMDYGTICERLFTGYYSRQAVQESTTTIRNATKSIRDASDSLRVVTWTERQFCDARGLFKSSKTRRNGLQLLLQGNPQKKYVLEEYDLALQELQTILEERSNEMRQREQKQLDAIANIDSIKTDVENDIQSRSTGRATDMTYFVKNENIRQLLAVDDMVPTCIQFVSSPLGIKIGDAAYAGTGMFLVSVTWMDDNLPIRSSGNGKHALSLGDRVVIVGNQLVAGMDTMAVANIFRQAQFPLNVVFGKFHENAMNFQSHEILKVPPLAAKPNEENSVTPNEEDDEEEDYDDLDTMGNAIDGLYADVQLVALNCVKFNSRRAEISIYAQASKDRFDALYQSKVLAPLELLENAEILQKQEMRRKQANREISNLTPSQVVKILQTTNVGDITPAVRAWILAWLLESMLQTEAVRASVETGLPSETLENMVLPNRRTKNQDDTISTNVTPGPLIRMEPLGLDRFSNRYWWFDGDALGRVFVEFVRHAQTSDDCASQLSAMSEAEKKMTDPSYLPSWGTLNTREQLDSLIHSLNPLGENELRLLKNLYVHYRRILSRHTLSQYPSWNTPPIQQNEEWSNLELNNKVRYGVEVAAFNKPFQKKTFDEEMRPVVPYHYLGQYRLAHHTYQNTQRGSFHAAARRATIDARLGGEDVSNIPSRVIRFAKATQGEGLNMRNALIEFLYAAESLIWEMRIPEAMGSRWPWRRRRAFWYHELESLDSPMTLSYQSEETSWNGVGGRGMSADHTADEIATVKRVVLEFERDCVSYFENEETSPFGCMVNTRWRMERLAWVGAVEEATTFSTIAVLVRRMMLDSIRWKDGDRSLHVLYVQHSHDRRTMEKESCELAPWGRPDADDCLGDVSFGQVVSQEKWLELFGFVGMGCFLGSYLHHALFQKARTIYEGQLKKSHVFAATICSSVAFRQTVEAAVYGGVAFSGKTSYVPRNLETTARLSDTDASMELLRKALLRIMKYMNIRQKDIADQMGCSQSHLSLWLNDRDGVNRRNFEPKIIHWIRAKNLEFQFVRPEDVTDSDGNPININDQVEMIQPFIGNPPEPIGLEISKEEVAEAVLPVIKAICADGNMSSLLGSASSTGYQDDMSSIGGQSQMVTRNNDYNSTPDTTPAAERKTFLDCTFQNPGHPYATVHKNARNLTWSQVIPYSIVTCSPRNNQVAETDVKSWLSTFSTPIRMKIEAAGLDTLEAGTSQVVYFPEGHAFANAQGELRMATEMIRSQRESAYGPAIDSVISSREPILCEVKSVSYHLAFSSYRRSAPVTFALLELEEVNCSHQRIPMLDIGLGESSSRQQMNLGDILLRVMTALLSSGEASLCSKFVTEAAYSDLFKILPRDEIIDLDTIYQNVLESKYQTVEAFVHDLTRMSKCLMTYFLEVHQSNHVTVQAASILLFKAKTLLRHPETLCMLHELAEDTKSLNNDQALTFTIVLRPQFEYSMPTYLVSYEKYQNAIAANFFVDPSKPRSYQPSASSLSSEWKIGGRIIRRWEMTAPPKKPSGVIVGFRFPTKRMQLPWGVLVVKWAEEAPMALADNTVNLPRFCLEHVNPWDVIQVAQTRER